MVSGSALINTGVDIASFTTDITGGVRSSPFDIGAYEFAPCANPLIVTKATDAQSAAGGECGDLRYAINYANKKVGPDEITFDILGTGPFVIELNDALPDISDALIINGRVDAMGYTKPKSSDKADYQLVIEIDGIKNNVIRNGFTIKASDVKIRGLSIIGFTDAGVYAENANNVAVEGCFLGLRANGTIIKNGNGVKFSNVKNTTGQISNIGGGSTYDINVICASNGDGIQLINSVGVYVIRNFIGVNSDGVTANPNKGYGLYLEGCDSVKIGLDMSGGFGNVISGNSNDQVYIKSSTVTEFYGNKIGVGIDGAKAIKSPANGINIDDSKSSIIGSIDFPNIIANNTFYGIQFSGSSAYNNSIVSNSIYNNGSTGTNAGISIAVGSQESVNNPTINSVILETDGSATLNVTTSTNADNVSFYADLGNQGQVFLVSQPYVANGNYIIPVAAVSTAKTILGSTFNITATQTTSGGSTSEFSAPKELKTCDPLVVTKDTDDNVITGVCGDLRFAINYANKETGNHVISFNITGGTIPYTIKLQAPLPDLTNIAGTVIDGFSQPGSKPNSVPVFSATATNAMDATYGIVLGNASNIAVGLNLKSNNNVVKGLVLQDFGDGNPSNNDIAINIGGNNNKVLGCVIGLDETGLLAGTKTAIGIEISGNNNIIGDGTPAGANLISGLNDQYSCIEIVGTATATNTISGNMIGLLKDGVTKTTGTTSSYGIHLAAGANVVSGNVISGRGTGVNIGGNTSSISNIIKGNIIGLQANGSTYVSGNNQNIGVYITASGNTIGGSTIAERNIISGNVNYGVLLSGLACSTNVVKGNYVGLNKTGTGVISGSSQDIGIYLALSASRNIIGGDATLGEGNVVSGNRVEGITSNSDAIAGNTIIGNIVGPQADGLAKLASSTQDRGVLFGGSPNNVLGGTSIGHRNIISSNLSVGVYLSGIACSTNVIKGNYIGTDKTGLNAIPSGSQAYGIQIDASASNNTIGGALANESNVIANNSYGIYASTIGAVNNKFSGNSIFSNTIKGINLNYGTNAANGGKVVPVITSATPGLVSGTGNIAGDTIQLFSNKPIATGTKAQGKTYVGSAKVLTDLSWSFSPTPKLILGDSITATATDATKGTSEFSAAKVVGLSTPGAALDFDGFDDYVTVPNGSSMFANKTAFTMEGWAFLTNAKPKGTLPIDYDGLFGIRGNSTNQFYLLQIGDGNNQWIEARFTNSTGAFVDLKVVPTLNTWHHYAFTYNGSEVALYFDGVIVDSMPASGTINDATLPLWIGDNYNQSLHYYLDGQIDEVRIWDRALCKDAILASMNADVLLNKTGLLAQYSLNQGIASGNNAGITTVIDSTGNYNGTLSAGFNLSGTTSNWVESSAITTGTVSGSGLCPLPPPSKVCAKPLGKSVEVSWDPVAGVTNYTVFYGVDTTAGTLFSEVVNGPSVPTVISNDLVLDKINYFSVSANGGIPSKFKAAVPVVESGRAMTFGNNKGFVKFPNFISFDDTDFTLSFWVKGQPGQGRMIFSTRSSDELFEDGNWLQLFVRSNNAIGIESSKTTTSGSTYLTKTGTIPIFDGEWHNVVLVRDAGASYSTYVDGRLDFSYTEPVASKFVKNVAMIGDNEYNNQNGTGPYYSFDLDEFAYFKKALTATEIGSLNLVSKPLTGSETGLVGLWHFDEPSGNIAYDASCNGNNGVWNGLLSAVDSKAMFPYKPTGLKTSISNGVQSLVWDKNIALDIKNYNIFKYNVLTSTWDSLTSVTNETYDLGSSCTVEKYKIYAQDQNFQKGEFSDEIVVQPYSSLSDGLIVYYPFDGDAIDASGNGNDGTVYGAVLSTDRHGKSSSSYFFNGVNNGIRVGTSDVLPEDNFSLSLFFKADGKGRLFRRRFYAMGLGILATGELQLELYDDAQRLIKLGSFLDSKWHHVTINYSNADINIYVDGILKSTTPYLKKLRMDGFDKSTIIGTDSSGTNYFKGNIDEFRLYNRVLTEEEIAILSERVIPETQEICGVGNPYSLTPVAISGAKYTWTLPTGSNAIVNTTSNALEFKTVAVSDAGKYQVKVDAGCLSFTNEIDLKVIEVDTAVTKSFGSICNGNPVVLKFVKTDADTIIWSYKVSKSGVSKNIRTIIGNTQDTIRVAERGDYLMTKKKGSCSFEGSYINLEKTNFIVDLGPVSSLICKPDTLLKFTKTGVVFEWFKDGNSISTLDNITANSNGKYKVNADSLGCTSSDEIDLTFDQTVLELGKDTAVCEAIFTLKSPIVANSYEWFDANKKSIFTKQNHDVTISGLYVLNLTSTMGCKFKDSLTVTVGTTNVAGTIKAISTTICANDSIRLQTYNSSGALQWQEHDGTKWNDLPNEINSKLTVSAATKTSGHKYRVLAGANTSCPVSSDSVVITITSAPTVDAGISSSVCELTPDVDLLGTTSGTTSTIWSAKGTGVFTFSNTLSTKYTLSPVEISAGKTMLYLKGLSSTCPEVLDSVEVNVTNKTTPSLSLTILESNICENQQLTLKSVLTGVLETEVNFSWSKNTLAQSNTSATFVDKVKTGDVYEVKVSPKSGLCIAEATTTKTFAASDFASCVPLFDLKPSKTIVCPNEEVTLSTTGVGTNYTWTIEGTTLTGKSVLYTFKTSGLKDIALTIDGVERKELGLITVTTFTIPVITAIPLSRMSCENANPVVLSASGLSNPQWYKEEGTVKRKIFAATQTSLEVYEPGFYSVKGQISTCPVEVAAIEVLEGSPKPTATGTTLLIASTAPAYQWYVLYKGEKRAIVGAITNTYKPLYNGNYFVETINIFCRRMSDMIGVTQATLRNIEESEFKISGSEIFIENFQTTLALHPNPAHEKVIISYVSPYGGNVEVSITTVTGKEVYHQSVQKQVGLLELEVETKIHDSNVLIIRVQEGANYHYEKLILY